MTIGLIRLGFSLTPPDVTAPTVPTALVGTPDNGMVTLAWSASTDAIGVTGYRIYKNGSLLKTVTGLTTTDTGLTNGTAYTYAVSAIDAAGNASAQASFGALTPYQTYAADTFTRANSSSVGSTEVGGYAWAGIGGGGSAWSILSNTLAKANGTAPSTAPNMLAFSDGQADGVIEVTFVNGALAQGYAFREASDGSGGWLVSVDAAGAWLLRRHAGTTYTTIDTEPTLGTPTNKLITITLSGSSITVRMNGTVILTATDATYATNTYQGPWVAVSNAIAYDNIKHRSH